MDENQEQHINAEQTNDQTQDIPLNTTETQLKKKTIPTRFGSLIILLTATIAGAGVWWYSFSYEKPVPMDVGKVVRELQARREVVTATTTELPEFPLDYEVKDDGVYYKGALIEGADPETFELTGCDYYGKDDKHVYHGRETLQYNVLETNFFSSSVRTCTTKSCSQSRQCFISTKTEVTYPGEKQEILFDAQTFGVLGDGLVKDKSGVYSFEHREWYDDRWRTELVFSEFEIDIDVDTFESLDDGYYRDKNKLYYRKDHPEEYVVVEGVDLNTFEVFGDGYGRDKNKLYHTYNIIDSGDPSSIEYINTYIFECSDMWSDSSLSYYKDNNNVYLGGKKLIDSDPDTFEYVGSSDCKAYSKDENNVYDRNGEKTGAIPEECTLDAIQKCYVSHACLAPDTKILMSSGSYKNIENIQVGDLVTSFDTETKEYKTAKVDKVIKRKDPLVIINNTLRAAPDEPVYLADGSIKEAVDIKVGDYLVNEKGEQVKVNTIEQDPELVDTYDFTLENGDNFFADGILVGTPNLNF